VLSLSAAGIQDAGANALAADQSSDFTVDTVAPTVAITPVSPDPRNSAVDSMTIAFSKPVVGLTLGSLQFNVGGGANLLTSAQTLTTADNMTWTLGNLAGLTPASGTYSLTLLPASITDAVGNALAAGASSSFTLHAWQNTPDRFDVNAQGGVTPIDALTVINYLNLHGPAILPPTFTGPNYLDVNGDDDVSALDALGVINFLDGLLSSGGSPTVVSAQAADVVVSPDVVASPDVTAALSSAAAQSPAAPVPAATAVDAAVAWAVSAGLASHQPAALTSSVTAGQTLLGTAETTTTSSGLSAADRTPAAGRPYVGGEARAKSADGAIREAVWGADEFDSSEPLSERLLTLLEAARRPSGRSA
jgi:hypothetical protein